MPNVICGCGRSVETKPEWAGQWISCTGCGGTLYAPFPGDKPAPPVPVIERAPLPAAPAGAPTRLCPWCAETIPVSATACPICKGDANARPTRPAAVAAPAPATSDNGGMMPLVIGIIGFMFCQLISPVAWALGSRYEKDCRARGLAPSGAGTAGKILGIAGTCFLFLAIAFGIVSAIFQA